MSAFALRIVFGVWLVVWALLMLKALSLALFGRQAGWPGRLLKAVVLAPAWPLAVLSRQGRDALRAVFFYQGGVE